MCLILFVEIVNSHIEPIPVLSLSGQSENRPLIALIALIIAYANRTFRLVIYQEFFR